MAALVAAIHVFEPQRKKAWMPGTRPGMTVDDFETRRRRGLPGLLKWCRGALEPPMLRAYHAGPQMEGSMSLKRLFTEHPESVGESYFEHMGVALSFAGPLLKAGLAALVHAFLPFLCTSTASGTVKRLYARMMNRVPRPAPQTAALDGMPSWDPVI
jgi:hypothetical protein